MHPVLFRVPLPALPLPLFWALLAAAAVALVVGGWLLARRTKQSKVGALVAGCIGAAFAIAAFRFQGEVFELGPLPIYSYGVMLGLSLVVGWYLTLGLAERDGLPKDTMANNYLVTAFAAIAGARLLYVLTNLGEFDSIADVFAMRRGGLVAYGGFLGGFLGSLLFLRSHRIPLLPWADVAVPSLASGLLITRIGCYLFGCDFGKPLAETAPAFLKKLGSFPHWPEGTVPYGSGAPAWVQHVKQRGLSPAATHSLPVHPTQLYESLVGAALLVLLLVSRRHQAFRGQIFLLFTFAYGVCRFGLEMLRDDAERGSLPPALPEHVLLPLSLAIFAVAYAIGFSQAIRSQTVRRVTQGLAFVPAIALFVALKPESFAGSASIQLSTSQGVALTTGFAAAVAFSVFHKAALAHPEAAMALNLPPPKDEDAEEGDNVADADEDEPRAKGRRLEAARERAAGAAGREGAGKAAPKPKKKSASAKTDGHARRDADAGEDPPASARRGPTASGVVGDEASSERGAASSE